MKEIKEADLIGRIDTLPPETRARVLEHWDVMRAMGGELREVRITPSESGHHVALIMQYATINIYPPECK